MNTCIPVALKKEVRSLAVIGRHKTQSVLLHIIEVCALLVMIIILYSNISR